MSVVLVFIQNEDFFGKQFIVIQKSCTLQVYLLSLTTYFRLYMSYVLSAQCLSATGYGTWEHRRSLDLIYSSQQSRQTHQLSLLLLLTFSNAVSVELSLMHSLVVLIHWMLSLSHCHPCHQHQPQQPQTYQHPLLRCVGPIKVEPGPCSSGQRSH